MRPDLIALARQRMIDDLDKAWETHASDPGDTSHYRQTIQILIEQDLVGRATQLATRIVDALANVSRLHDAIAVATDVVRLGAHNESLAERLRNLYELAFSDEEWYPLAQQRAGLHEGTPTTEKFLNFDRYRRYTVGNVVYHRSGWDEGLIERFDVARGEVTVRFASGRTMELPLASVYESMTPLDDDDLRAMRLKSLDELQKLAAEKPSALVRKAAKILRGRVSGTELKEMLVPTVIPEKSWAGFWKRARAAAAVDPYLQVGGSATRPVFELRRKPLTLIEEAKLAMRDADDLGGEIAACREYLDRCPDDETRTQVLDAAQQRIQEALVRIADGTATRRPSHAHVLDGLLLLERSGRPLTAEITRELRALLLDQDGRLVPENFDRLATQDACDHAVELLPQAIGEGWADLCLDALLRVPATVAEQVVELLVAHGHAAALLRLWPLIAPFPRRHPVLTYLFARLHGEGSFAGMPGAPDDVTVARVLLHVARTLVTERRDPQQTRLLGRIVTFLTGRKGFLQRAVEEIDRDSLATLLGIAERGGEEFPQEIIDVILRAVARLYPDLTAKPERPFWEEDAIYTTRAGLERQREEYRKLVEEKIPTNSKAIGAAAALGDLSENSEWDAALEEQRNLTTRASIMDQELRRARLLEETLIPEGIVAPGTRVLLKATETGETRVLQILGPWDGNEGGTVNYRAPVARPLLGCGVGDEVQVMTEHGVEPMRIDSIEKLV